MVIAVLNSKGGVGKTTIATNLAACFATDKKDVLLIDADPQASALEWKAARPEDALPLQVIGLPSANLHQEVKRLRTKYELLIIDSGGRVTETARAAAAIADLVLVPTLPSRYDIAATQEFFSKVLGEVMAFKEAVRAAIILNQVQTGTAISQAAQEQISALEHPIMNSVLHLYVAYKESAAHGLSVIENDKSSKAAEEMAGLFKELKRAL
jgi:chromosome partitioning protein